MAKAELYLMKNTALHLTPLAIIALVPLCRHQRSICLQRISAALINDLKNEQRTGPATKKRYGPLASCYRSPFSLSPYPLQILLHLQNVFTEKCISTNTEPSDSWVQLTRVIDQFPLYNMSLISNFIFITICKIIRVVTSQCGASCAVLFTDARDPIHSIPLHWCKLNKPTWKEINDEFATIPGCERNNIPRVFGSKTAFVKHTDDALLNFCFCGWVMLFTKSWSVVLWTTAQ